MDAFDLPEYAAQCKAADIGRFLEKCETLRLFLEDRNRHVNLTRLTSADDFYIKHVADSLSIARFFPEVASEKLTIADIGCGAGFPSMILALAFPKLSVYAIDSVGKKIDFVAEAAKELGIGNITPIHGRSAELNCRGEFQGRFDIVTARAVAPSPKIYREANRFPSVSGRFIFYKTPGQAEEERPLLAACKNIRWSNTGIFTLPCGAGERLFTVGRPVRTK